MTGIEAFLEVLASAGVRYIFGNPGTTELPLNDALAADDRFEYVFGLQEIPVVGMADGFAQASRRIAVANVHISCGLGNAMGMLYNAHCAGSPVLLTAGQQDRRLRFSEPVLYGDLIGVARPWTKWAYEVERVEDVPAATRKAIHTALTLPTGPVFLSLPIDVQTGSAEWDDVSCGTLADSRSRPSAEAVAQAAHALLTAKKPVILAGSRVVESAAVTDLVRLAELLGADVLVESSASRGRFPFPTDHPLFSGSLPLWSPEIHQCLGQYDVALIVGMSFPRLYIYLEPARVVPDGLRLVQMDCDSRQIGKVYPVEVGLVCDLQAGLKELADRVADGTSPEKAKAAASRREQAAKRRSKERDETQRRLDDQRQARPMSPMTMLAALAKVLPDNAAWVDEAVTTGSRLLAQLQVLKDPAGYFGHRGWALGWGIGCAMGVKLAWPERPVIALLGDGAALYSIQGLWTAAHHRIPVLFVICNNGQYKILKQSAGVLPLPRMAAGRFVAMDLIEPEVDFVGLAKGFGVDAYRVSEPDELSERAQQALASHEPCLLDVVIAR